MRIKAKHSWAIGYALLLLVAGCAKHEVVAPPLSKVETPHPVEAAPPVVSRLMDVQRDSEIDLVMREVRQGDLAPAQGQQQLNQLIATAPPVLADEARFRAAELQLEFDDPYADVTASVLFDGWPDHALIPHLHYWLSGWLQRRGEVSAALQQLAVVIDGSSRDIELRGKSLQAGLALVGTVDDDATAVRWLLRRMVVLQGDDLRRVARLAAMRSSMPLMVQLRQQGVINQPLYAPYFREVARMALMRGDRAALATIAGWVERDMAATPEAAMIRRWHSGSSRAVRIGVLLPLSGRYARFGVRALHGVRMAVSRLPYGDKVTLVVADSDGNAGAAIDGYQRLVHAGCTVVIGPVLAANARAIAPYLRPDIPVISMTNQREVARLAPALFVHSVGAQVQADFVAGVVRKLLDKQPATTDVLQVAVIATRAKASQESATLFQQQLELGGDVTVHRLTIDDAVDERRQLIALRRDSDDGLLLDELDQDLALFFAETDLQPVVPSALTAIYLPLTGKQVARLAGQLAYVGLNQMPILGDSRWQDGHLFDDHGRYLATARVGVVPWLLHRRKRAVLSYPDAAEYRQLWGDHADSLLGAVAFDSLVIAATLTSSWGLQGYALVRALHDSGGFPLVTGDVVFDCDGIGHKSLALLAVRDGALVAEQ